MLRWVTLMVGKAMAKGKRYHGKRKSIACPAGRLSSDEYRIVNQGLIRGARRKLHLFPLSNTISPKWRNLPDPENTFHVISSSGIESDRESSPSSSCVWVGLLNQYNILCIPIYQHLFMYIYIAWRQTGSRVE